MYGSFPVVVRFARGAAAPDLESLNSLHACGRWLARHPRERVTVVGHANTRGWDRYAKGLARARVAAVTHLLTLLGATRAQLVPLRSARLHAVRFGSTSGERQRGRVVVVFRHEPDR